MIFCPFYFADVRSYVKEVIMNLVTVHAQVGMKKHAKYSPRSCCCVSDLK